MQLTVDATDEVDAVIVEGCVGGGCRHLLYVVHYSLCKHKAQGRLLIDMGIDSSCL